MRNKKRLRTGICSKEICRAVLPETRKSQLCASCQFFVDQERKPRHIYKKTERRTGLCRKPSCRVELPIARKAPYCSDCAKRMVQARAPRPYKPRGPRHDGYCMNLLCRVVMPEGRTILHCIDCTQKIHISRTHCRGGNCKKELPSGRKTPYCLECTASRANRPHNKSRAKIWKQTQEYKNWNSNYIAKRYAENRDVLRVRKSEYQKSPEGKAYAVVAKSRRRSLMVGSEGSYTKTEWLAVIERQNSICLYCKIYTKLHADHIIPLKRGGSNYISNIQGLCGPCNSRKGIKLPDEMKISV